MENVNKFLVVAENPKHLSSDSSQISTKSPTSEFLKEELVASGKWLCLKNFYFRDPTGRERTWEVVGRRADDDRRVQAVAIVAVLKRALKFDCVLCVRQYRPPLRAYTLEFPAGLMDTGENAEVTAVRELWEETGYHGIVTSVSPPTALDPGTEDCTVSLVTMQIDGDDNANLSPHQHLEDGEFIEVLCVPQRELLHTLEAHVHHGDVIDSRLYSYALAWFHVGLELGVVPATK